MIKEIAFTAYPAKDVAGLRKWYEDKLGFTFSGPYEEDGVEKYNEANVGGGYFSVLTQEWADREPGSASGVVFEVDDIDDTVDETSRPKASMSRIRTRRRSARLLPSAISRATRSRSTK